MGWIEGRRRWVWLAGLTFVALLLTPVGVSDAVPVASGEDIMVIAAHPDDDIITAAGITQDTIDAGGDAKIAFVTNGDLCETPSECLPYDSGDNSGTVRQGEAVDGQAILGNAESNLIFLGYPNGYLSEMRYDGAFPPDMAHSETYATRGLGGEDWHSYRNGGVPAAYNQANLHGDLVDLIDYFRPDHIFTHSVFDRHQDHEKTYFAVIEALEVVQTSNPGYSTYVHTTIVHIEDSDDCWPDHNHPDCDWGDWPNTADPTAYVNKYYDLGADTNNELVWDRRESFEVPPNMQNPILSQNKKSQAVEAHVTQAPAEFGFIRRFIHKDEIFWVEKYGDPEGVADSYTVAEGGPISSGVLMNDVRGFGTLPGGGDPTPLGPMSASLVDGPDHALPPFLLDSDGSFAYTHDGSETTTDSFTYRPVQGSTNGSTTTVTITINPINDAPTAVADGPYTAAYGAITNLPVLGNDTDPENDSLTAVEDVPPQHGTLVPNAGGFAYTHDGLATTSDSFTYHVRDSGGLTSGPVSVSLDISDGAPDPLSVAVTGPAFGSPGTTATYAASVGGGSGSASVTWSVMRSGVEVELGAGATFEFEPGLAGAHTVAATVEDGADSDSDSLELTVMGDIAGNVFAPDILWLAEEGITFGCNPPVNDQFCPKAPVTRGQMAAFLVRFLGLTASDGSINFTDTVGNIFEGDIRKLATAGITRGCNPPANTQFCPNASVTRGQMAAFLVRALGLKDDGGGDLFTDDNGSIFEADIDRLATAGVTRGCNADGTHFCPNGSVTREQMAAFLHRAAGLLPGG